MINNNNRLKRIKKRIEQKCKSNKYNKVILKLKDGLYLYTFLPSYNVSKLELLPTNNNYDYLPNESISIDDVCVVSNGRTEPLVIIADYEDNI